MGDKMGTTFGRFAPKIWEREKNVHAKFGAISDNLIANISGMDPQISNWKVFEQLQPLKHVGIKNI